MSKRKQLWNGLCRGAMTSVAAMAMLVTAGNVSTCCWFILGQGKLPDNAQKLRKF